jgi:hypothetical protein
MVKKQEVTLLLETHAQLTEFCVYLSVFFRNGFAVVTKSQ